MEPNRTKKFYLVSYSILNIFLGMFISLAILYPAVYIWFFIEQGWINSNLLYLLRVVGKFFPSFHLLRPFDVSFWKMNMYTLHSNLYLLLRFEILYLLLIYLICLFKKVLQSAYIETPFNLDNAKHIKRIGLIIAFTPLALLILDTIYMQLGLPYTALFNKNFTTWLMFSFTLKWLFFAGLGFLLIAIGEIFRNGVELKQENDLTV